MSNFPCLSSEVAYRTFKRRTGRGLLLFALLFHVSWAKDIPITGILLYGSKDASAYVQISGFTINGKTELRACNGSSAIDKSAYKNLLKIPLTSVKSLERLPDGSMVAEVGESPASCVVPSNFKWEKVSALTPAELAEQSNYAAAIVGSSGASPSTLPPFAPGTKLIFGSATDKELADYLLADRVQTIASLQAYRVAYPAGPHASQSAVRLSSLMIQDGTKNLDIYKKSMSNPAPDYAALKQANERAEQAVALPGATPAGAALQEMVRGELKSLCDSAAAKLQAFQAATKSHEKGYPLLVAAKDISAHVSEIDPKFPPGMALASSIGLETHSLDSIVQTANRQIASQQYRDAFASITKYRSIAEEEPRLQQIVNTTYKYYRDKGNGEIAESDWSNAVADLKQAAEINPGPGADGELAKAEAGQRAAVNKAAADRALETSKTRSDDKDTIGAYEILADLPAEQKALVSDRLSELQDAYIQSAIARAKELQVSHTPIRGRADEDGVRLAYAYLDRVSKLSDNPDIQLKLGVLADTISAYYVNLATSYLNKPLSSGVGLGWSFLNEAAQYNPHLSTIHDAQTTNSAAYRMRAELSIGVLFRDQTSRRESAGFADQLQQAFPRGLEATGLPVRVILPGSSEALEPNFKFVGVIVDHRTVRTPKKETLQSHYRSGFRDIPSEAWNKADQEYEAALLTLDKAKDIRSAAVTKGNKKAIDAADKDIATIQETVQQARSKMNSLPKDISEPIVSPYNYTKTTLELSNIVELSVRILDLDGNPVGEPIHVVKGEKPKQFVIVENIKPEDTEGVKEVDVMPDDLQLMTNVENEARDEVVAAARERVLELPKRILAKARNDVTNNDFDGAGEAYVLYLDCTQASNTAERSEATAFLDKNFNIRNTLNLSASVKH